MAVWVVFVYKEVAILVDLDLLGGVWSGVFVLVLVVFVLGLGFQGGFARGSFSSGGVGVLDGVGSEKVFLFVMLSNLCGLSGSWEPVSVWPCVVLSMSFLSWGSTFCRWCSGNYKSMLSHMTPGGLSMVGSIPMSVIEILSSLIRPLTLGLRLCANILGGHLIFDLLGEFGSGVLVYLSLSLYESFVSIMQGVIFSLLLLSYMEEVEGSL